jgi:C4-dicarboxylate-specific signal transduction histidine kinase
MARLRRALNGEEFREDEQPVPSGPEHAPRWRSLMVMPWRRGGGEIAGVLVRIDDVTDIVTARRARERQQESRMQMLAMFAGGVAHEINSPLQVIGIEAHLIATALEGDEASIDELRKSARSIREMASRAMAITRALRTLSRDPHGDPVEAVSVAAVCEQACVLVQARFRAAGVRLDRVEVVADLCARTRPSELLHVLVNLLDNAQMAARQGAPWVRLETDAEGDEVVLRCVDGGVGVPPHVQPLLGEPILSDRASGAGAGVGLSIVKVLAERSGGSLRYLAAADHTTFEVRFPRAAGATA